MNVNEQSAMEKIIKAATTEKNNSSLTNHVDILSKKNLLQMKLLSTLPHIEALSWKQFKKTFIQLYQETKCHTCKFFYWIIPVWEDEIHLGKHKHKSKSVQWRSHPET